MDKADTEELDLFAQNTAGARRRSAGSGFLLYFRRYERAIMILIAFMVTAIVAFALGVEQGKRYVRAQAPVRVEHKLEDAWPHRLPAPTPAAEPKSAPKPEAPQAPVALVKSVPGYNYTIQVASYKNRALAQNEADDLRKKGFASTIMVKGAYMVLCVGKFPDKESARSLLTQLSKQYQGCLIRRI